MSKPIGIYGISNNLALLIFEIDENEDRALIGRDYKSAKWSDIHYSPMRDDIEDDDIPYTMYGDIIVPFSLVMRY